MTRAPHITAGLYADTIVFFESEVRIGLSRGWCEEYRVYVNWEWDLTDNDEYPLVAHITLSDDPADVAHDLLSAPAGSLPRQLGERLKLEFEGSSSFNEAARDAGGKDALTTTAADERREIAREYA